MIGGNERIGRGGKCVVIEERETFGLIEGQAGTSAVLSFKISAAGEGAFRSTNSWSAVSVGTLCISCKTGKHNTQPERRPYLLVFPMPPPDINANCGNQQTDTREHQSEYTDCCVVRNLASALEEKWDCCALCRTGE